MVLVLACVTTLSMAGAARTVPPDADEAIFTGTIKPFLFRNCYQCHNERKTRGNLNLKQYADAASVLADPNTWEHVLLKIRTGEMPPEDEPRPTAFELRLVSEWVDAQILRADRAAPPDPGRVTIRRLNRTELQQHDPRSARCGPQARRRFPSGRLRVRLRQHRRRAIAAAGPDGALSRGGRARHARRNLRHTYHEADARAPTAPPAHRAANGAPARDLRRDRAQPAECRAHDVSLSRRWRVTRSVW